MPAVPDLRVAMTVEQLWQRAPGGSGTYIVELTRALADVAGTRVVGLAARHRGAAPADWRVEVPVRHAPLPRRALYDAWQHLGHPRAEALVQGADVVHATTWAIPPTRAPLVVTIHDVAFLHDRVHFTRRGNAFFRRALRQARAATAIIVPSVVTADDCAAVGIDPGLITVIPHGSRVSEPSELEVGSWRRAHGVQRDYVLWCGTVEPRKNLPRLLEAYARAELDDIDLVLVGPAGWGGLPPVPSRLDASRVHVLGHLSRQELDAAYAGARAFCFPSIREGFGLPVLEAMQHGVPVVTSRGTACAEVAGDAALLVDPLEPDEIAAALRAATGSERADLQRRSRARAGTFSWERAALATAQVYRTVT